MAEIKSIELVTDAEKKLDSYREFLEGLAKREKTGIITNKGKEHASILMATLLANTDKSLKMYCTGLLPDILDELNGAYWKVFQEFFKNREKLKSVKVEILVQDDHRAKVEMGEPFKVLKMAQEIDPNYITIKLIKENGKKKINDYLGFEEDINVNFSVFDSKAFRLEYDTKEYKAIGSFDDENRCKILSDIFDTVFNDSTYNFGTIKL